MKYIQLLIVVVILLFQNSAFANQKETVKMIFQSDQEPTAKDAVWTADNIFKVGVINDGTPRNGYAMYVCEVLYEHGFKGMGVYVHVIDIVALSKKGRWVDLGKTRCK